jgi:hypothetical protein
LSLTGAIAQNREAEGIRRRRAPNAQQKRKEQRAKDEGTAELNSDSQAMQHLSWYSRKAREG